MREHVRYCRHHGADNNTEDVQNPDPNPIVPRDERCHAGKSHTYIFISPRTLCGDSNSALRVHASMYTDMYIHIPTHCAGIVIGIARSPELKIAEIIQTISLELVPTPAFAAVLSYHRTRPQPIEVKGGGFNNKNAPHKM